MIDNCSIQIGSSPSLAVGAGRFVAVSDSKTLVAAILSCFIAFSATCSAQQDYSRRQTSQSKAKVLQETERYVNSHDQLLSPSQLRKVLRNEKLDLRNLNLHIAKGIPVYFKVGMDRSSIADLLAACATANPPIEIRNFRIEHPANSDDIYESSVEIYGVIRIYNPVSEDVLLAGTSSHSANRR